MGETWKHGEDGCLMKKAGYKKSSTARKRRYQAPNHIKRRFLSAPLSPSLRSQHGTRAMPVVTDDTVTITKGDRKLTEAKVLRVDTDEARVFLEGVTRTRMDGSSVHIPIRTGNVMITKLNLNDDWRKKILERRGFNKQE